MPADLHKLCGKPVTLVRDYDGAEAYYVHTETGTTDCPAAPGRHLPLATPETGITSEHSEALDEIAETLRDTLGNDDGIDFIELAAKIGDALDLGKLLADAEVLDRIADRVRLDEDGTWTDQDGILESIGNTIEATGRKVWDDEGLDL